MAKRKGLMKFFDFGKPYSTQDMVEQEQDRLSGISKEDFYKKWTRGGCDE